MESRDVAYLKPPYLSNKSWILGIGQSYFPIVIFSFLKSEKNFTALFIFRVVKDDVADWELSIFFNTHNSPNLFTSFLKVGSWDFDIWKGYDMA